MRRFLLVLAVAALGFAPAPLPRSDRGRADRHQIHGTWRLKQVRYVGSTDYTGAWVGAGVIYVPDEVTISATEMRVRPGDPRKGESRRRIPIEVQAVRRHVDFLQSREREGRVPAIYRVEGATLTICYPTGGSTVRPTTFDNPRDLVLVFERVRR
jgi:uncharacterized protein (TIGR03067 family)